VSEAEDPATSHASASLQEIHASTTFITVGGQIRITKEAELCHRFAPGSPASCTCSAGHAPEVFADTLPTKDASALVRRAAIASFLRR